MKIPTKIKIMGLTYDVVYIKDKMEEDAFFGRSWTEDQKIKINKSISKDRQDKVFLHELLHMILDESSFKDEAKDEKLIDCLSNNLYTIFTDNKLF
jgi:Zn-dependent peptidase ImmA (M78 family)